MTDTAPTSPVVLIREPGRSDLHILIVEPIYLGRSGSGILVDDGQVSRQHLELWPVGNVVGIRDCGSAHGTTMNGEPVSDTDVLTAGSVVYCGNVSIELLSPVSSTVPGHSSEPGRSTPKTSIEQVASLVDTAAPVAISARSDRTLTIVFSDIEDSTAIASTIGDTRWFEVLSLHNKLLRTSIANHGGTEIKSYGDGFMLTFDSARSAIDSLIAFQIALAQSDGALENIRVRAGAHVGEAIFDQDGDLFGRHVNIAARVAAAAEGGEILVSPLVREIVEARGDLVFGPSRTVSLKGISNSYTVHPVDWRGHQ